MPMHCSANHAADDPDDVAVFFGLSGTGKTTLSADPARVLIGDDEHGWSDDGAFNFEGGCYAKTINLSPEAEPEIYAHHPTFGTVVENMVYDPETCELDFDRRQPDREHPLRLSARRRSPTPAPRRAAASRSNIVMLTCDAFGVLPPIARLTPAQAMYHFLSGFTSKVAGTERGVTEPQPTFSTCFGAPFMPRRPEEYGALLRDRIADAGATCWLVNTGWTGGAYGTGRRMPIAATRALLTAALDGSLNAARVPPRPELRLRGSGRGAGRRRPTARSARDLGRSGRLRSRRPHGWSACSPTTSPSTKAMSATTSGPRPSRPPERDSRGELAAPARPQRGRAVPSIRRDWTAARSAPSARDATNVGAVHVGGSMRVGTAVGYAVNGCRARSRA